MNQITTTTYPTKDLTEVEFASKEYVAIMEQIFHIIQKDLENIVVGMPFIAAKKAALNHFIEGSGNFEFYVNMYLTCLPKYIVTDKNNIILEKG